MTEAERENAINKMVMEMQLDEMWMQESSKNRIEDGADIFGACDYCRADEALRWSKKQRLAVCEKCGEGNLNAHCTDVPRPHSEAKAVCRQEKSLKNRAAKNLWAGDFDQGIALLFVSFCVSVQFAPIWLSAFATAIAFLVMLFHE